MAGGQHGEPYTLRLSDDELTELAGAVRRRERAFSRVKVAVSGGKTWSMGSPEGWR